MTTTSTDITHPELGDDAFAVHMPRYSDMCPVCKPKAERGRHVTALHRSLTEFGYSTLTREEVDEAYDAALRGDEPTDIIGMMVAGQMREAGLVK